MISYVMPTRNRDGVLARTLERLGALSAHEAEVIVVDNASDTPVLAPAVLPNGVPVRVVRLKANLGTAARNIGVRGASAASGWVVMLDDDSYPLDAGHLAALREAPGDVAAVAAEIWLPSEGGKRVHESGGLPEVIIGCGAAIRRGAFEAAGGYDAAFDYYAEEYDLCAKFIRAGMRVSLDRRFGVMHHKEQQGRDFRRIVRNLTRNNAWVMQRYAPAGQRSALVRGEVARYRRIAAKEEAMGGWWRGAGDLAWTLWRQPRRELTAEQWARFTGLAAAREGLAAALRGGAVRRVAVVAGGKNEHVVRRAIDELGLVTIADAGEAEALVVGTLSPGPMLDAAAALEACGQRVIMPWAIDGRAAPAGAIAA